MAEAVGAGCTVLDPTLRGIEGHVMSAERLHGNDTTMPDRAVGNTDIARCWVYVRDDRPFGGTSPPAAMFYYSRDRGGEHPQQHLARNAGIFQADAYSGYAKLYAPDRQPDPILQAGCWAHARRLFFIFADVEGSPSSSPASAALEMEGRPHRYRRCRLKILAGRLRPTPDGYLSPDEDPAEVQLGPCPDPQPHRPGAPPRQPRNLQVETLSCIG
jgi:hypothetical protein